MNRQASRVSDGFTRSRTYKDIERTKGGFLECDQRALADNEILSIMVYLDNSAVLRSHEGKQHDLDYG